MPDGAGQGAGAAVTLLAIRRSPHIDWHCQPGELRMLSIWPFADAAPCGADRLFRRAAAVAAAVEQAVGQRSSDFGMP